MKILENKIVCIVLMVVLIAGGFLLGGYKGLAGQYQKVENVFFLGEDGDGILCGKRYGGARNFSYKHADRCEKISSEG